MHWWNNILFLVIKNHIFILVLLSETCHGLFEKTAILVISFYFDRKNVFLMFIMFLMHGFALFAFYFVSLIFCFDFTFFRPSSFWHCLFRQIWCIFNHYFLWVLVNLCGQEAWRRKRKKYSSHVIWWNSY